MNDHPTNRPTPRSPRLVIGVLILVMLAAIVSGPVGAGVFGRPISPETTVSSPADGAVVVGGDLLTGGNASHPVGVAGVRVVVRNLDDGTYWNGEAWQADFIRNEAVLDEAGQTEVVWSYQVPAQHLTDGRYRARGFAYSVEGNGDSYGGDLHEFVYRSGVRELPGPTPTIIELPTTSTTVPSTTVPSTTVPSTTVPSTTVPSTTVPSTTTTSSPGGCSDRSILLPCTGLLLGTSGDFAAADGSWQSPRADFLRQEERLGHRVDVCHEYHQWRDLVSRDWPGAETQALADDGRIIFANWKSPNSDPGDWALIAGGRHDADIRAAAAQVLDFGQPVFLTFFHEPEDDIKRAAAGDTGIEDQLVADYAAAFARIVRIFEQQGADNAIWVWNIQGWRGHYRLYEAGLYPGDDVIDWVSYNNYNWHGCDNHGDSRRWTEFQDVYQPFYDWLEADGPGRPGRNKPIMLGEWGTEENDGATNSDQTKAEWFDDARRHLADGTFPRIKAAIYFDTEGVRPDGSIQFCRWGLDSTREALASFRALMADPGLRPTWD